MESAIESRLLFRVPEGFTWHETHFCIGKREAVYLHSSARVNNTFEVDTTTSFQRALAALELSRGWVVARGLTEPCRSTAASI